MSGISNSSDVGAAVADGPRPTDWFGHPRGLTVLFLTEMWEKFSYFGMRALLVYYMTKALAFPQANASLIYGGYTAFAYFTPIFGGLIADRYLGRRRAVILGGSIMAAGHFMMAFEPLFFPALATIAIGNGFFLPSLPSQVQTLYAPGDLRRNTAYNVYYVGINIGGLLAPLVCGTLGEIYGWHWGFAAAGIGMCAGLVIYIAGGKYLPDTTVRRSATSQATAAGDDTFAKRMGVLLCVIAVVVVFRGAYEQVGNTVALFADSGVDRSVSGSWVIPGTWFQALNPLLVFAITPLLIVAWNRRMASGRPFAPLRKMALGALVVAAAYLLLALAALQPGASAQPASWLWLVVFFVIYTLGELYILPTGLALFGRLAPGTLAATSIAMWFSASFFGNLLAGGVGTLWSRFSPSEFFVFVAMIAATSSALLLLIDRSARSLLDETSTRAATGNSGTHP